MFSRNHPANGLESRSELRRHIAESALALKHSQVELLNQNRIFKSIFDTMAEGVIVADVRGAVLLWNPAAERIFGGGPCDASPAAWPEAYHVFLPDRETLCPADQFPLARAIRGESAGPIKLFLRNESVPKGIWISINAGPLQDDRGTVQGGIAVIRDISEQERAREVMAQQQQELERSNRDLEQFAYASSHDLQEPLRAVSGYCQLLARRYASQLEPKAAEYIAEAVDGARRMQALIEGLLAYSRVGRHGNPIVATDSQAAFDQALANLEAAIAECDAVITHGPLPIVPADGVQLVQLFQNLIGNAVKYRGDRQPEVHVAALRREKDWLFSVRDNGIGIEPKYTNRIFVIFQRLHTRSEYPGTGIGLSLCKRIVEHHGGHIWVESEPGVGSTFFFTLPAVAGERT